ncbi:hypothetical protein EK21DRAFT_86065 [Setomelanomma holmii]|uniref:Uncharacterized protein n=1 Tax=Setomelanomma holmii TaxID=210430 RepID=A0A9P4HFD5_9PLEO|nr:hypothetical protein EK21DRAFT_86065 [Setomelanomma holmii]
MNEPFSSFLPVFTRVRELWLTFHVPLISEHVQNGSSVSRSLRAVPIANYIVGFNSNLILELAELPKLTIAGICGCQNCSDQVIRSGVFTQGDEDMESLRAVSEISRQIKDGTKEQGREIEVRTWLLYGKGMLEETVLC